MANITGPAVMTGVAERSGEAKGRKEGRKEEEGEGEKKIPVTLLFADKETVRLRDKSVAPQQHLISTELTHQASRRELANHDAANPTINKFT